MSRERVRSSNFHSIERELLRQLVMKCAAKEIIDCKLNDTNTINMKNEMWQKLTVQFNSTTPFQARTVEHLKTCYKNLKTSDLRVFKSLEQASEDTRASNGTEDLEHVSLTEEVMRERKDSAEKQILFEEDNIQGPEPVVSLLNNADLLLPLEESDDLLSKLEVTEVTEWSRGLKTRGNRSKYLKIRRNMGVVSQDELRSKLELVELMKKRIETDAQMKQEILRRQLRQEKNKTAALQLKLIKQ